MKLAQILINNEIRLCAVINGALVDLSGLNDNGKVLPRNLNEAIEAKEDFWNILAELDLENAAKLPFDKAVFAPAVPSGGKILLVGLNYTEHAGECNEKLPQYPVLFSKYANTLSAHGERIKLPGASAQIDYEAELVVILGRGGKDISREEALSHVFAYTCGNDLSARDLQFRSSQWLIGKTSDGFAPTGPVLVSADTLDPSSLSISSRVNGELRQSSNTSLMIFDIPRIISYASSILTLEAGDIIFTGTPSGVIMGKPENERVWLKDGDVVEITIENIGTLRNEMVNSK